MPKRLAVGTSLAFPERRADSSAALFGARRNHSILRAACESLESRTLLSSTYFVSPSGSDSAPGTLAQPFKTIQEAANVASSGDAVDIEAGTYRESVKPAHSGVTFTNYNGQAVTVSGANVVNGWTSVGGSVYEASMPSDLGEGNNQVFVDGQMVDEARWPNSGPDVSNPTRATVGGYSNGVLYDQPITQGNGFWAGARITITPGQGWVAYTGIVNNSGPGWLQVSLPALGQNEQPIAGNNYFLSGKFQALDSPGEWYRDSSGALYLWDPNSDNPAWHTVEAKARQYAFDLTGVSNTTIEGINLFAATIHTNVWSGNTVINGISAKYLTQFNNLWGNGWSPPGPYGIELNGNNSILENSTIAYSAGDGVYVDGANVRVTNNLIHDVDYSGTDAAGIMVYGSNAEIDHNTIYNVGRDGINIQASPVQVLDNVVHDFLLQTYDGAGIYAVHDNGQGSPLAYNTIYNAHKNLSQGYGATGILLDNDSSHFSVHDNTTSNVDDGFKANYTSYSEQIYNNQFGATQDAMQTNGWTGFAYDWGGSQVYDNVFYNPTVMTGYNVSMWGNTYASGSPTLNVWVTYPSPVPSANPAPPGGAASGGTNSGSTSSGVQAASSPLNVGPKVPAKHAKGSAAGGSSTTATAAALAGSIQGTFKERAKTPKAAATYTLAAASAALAGIGTFRVSGTGIGAVKAGAATAVVRLVSAKGTITLALTAPNVKVSDPTPTNFTFVVSRATGLYKKFAATKGSVNLAFTPGRKLDGTFSLTLA
jgi:hypothetical protein